jgi:signal transduction histidine kinase
VNLIEQERAAVERLREADRFKSEFLSMVSHELRTPLAAIIGMTRTIAERGDELEQSVKDDFLEAIVKRGDQLQRLVGDLLQSSRDVELSTAPLDLSEVLNSAAADARRMYADAEMSVDAPDQLRIVGDAGRLRQVIDNLVTNAVKYAPGTAITIGAMRAGDDAILSVADEGPGMAEEKVKRAFEPFFQGESSGKESGVGLGLYICRKIIEAHGGVMTLHSVPGEGTTVALRVPVAGPPHLSA